jgi:hypothetical protein
MEVGFDAREIKGGFMKIDPKSPDLPLAWQEKPHYNLRVHWLTKTENTKTQEADTEIPEDEIEEFDEDQMELPKIGVSKQYPGWFMHFNVSTKFADSLEEILKEASKFIKNSDFSASSVGRISFSLFEQSNNFEAPAKPFKAQRLELIRQLETPKENINQFDFVRDAFVEVGDYALNASIEVLPFRDEFKTTFSEADNPLRSMIGLECEVFQGEGHDWEDIASGELEVDGNMVRVGSWSKEFENHDEVSGVAFEEASVHDEIQDTFYLFNLSDSSIENDDED